MRSAPPSPTSPARRRWLAATVAGAALLGPLLVTLPASAAAVSSISGVVTSGGQPVAEAEVIPYVYDSEFDEWVDEPANAVWTDDEGRYSMTGLRATAYRLEVADGDDHVGEFYQDAPTLEDATTVPLPSGTNRTGVNMQVAERPHIAGTVTDGDGEPLPDIWVTPLTWDEEWQEWAVPQYASFSQTDADGHYDLPGLLPETYRIEFADDSGAYDLQYFDGADSIEEGTDVVVGADASRTDVNVTMVGVGEAGVVRNTGLPMVTGHPGVGGTLTADPGRWAPGTGLSFAYQWLVGGAEVPGADDVTYVPVEADRDKTVAVRVTATRAGYTEGVATSEPTLPVGSLPPVANTVLPTVSGGTLVGSVLTATAGTWNPADGLTLSYQWLRAGTPVSGATNATYTTSSADVGSAMSVTVSAARSGYSRGSATSAPTGAIQLQALTSTAPPAITGTPIVGSTLTASTGTWSPNDGLTYAYQWSVGGTPKSGATGATYVPTNDDVWERVTVTVTASRTGYRPTSRTSTATAEVTQPALPNVTRPAVVGTPRVGQPLTATTGTWNPNDDLAFDYQWTVGGQWISDAWTDTYTPVASDAGKRIRVEVTAYHDDYDATTIVSAPTDAVAGPPIVNNTAPRITGVAQVGQKLTAQPGSWSGNPSMAYQWLVNGNPVAGQTDSTFVVPPTAMGRRVSVRVTASSPGQDPVPMTSAATAAVRAGVLRVVRAPAVTGPAKVGKTLRAVPGTVSPAATRATYQWLRNGRVIARATRATFKLTRADKGKKISVRVTYTRVGYTTLQKVSKATGKVKK